MNATLRKFGHPDSLLADFEHWCVLMRPAQATLGALVLGAKSEETAFSGLPAAAFAELSKATAAIEKALMRFRPYNKINYLMLMMVDPHVHFHVLPRYDRAQSFEGVSFSDPGWPGIPDLKANAAIEDAIKSTVLNNLRQCFAGG
jgi:diadenosine tetraphosphate (Ap4A) HIT family hydrolase